MSIRIIDAADTREVERLLSPRRDDDRATRQRVTRIVEAVRTGGDAAVRRFARQFDGLSGAWLRSSIASASGATGPCSALPSGSTACDRRLRFRATR